MRLHSIIACMLVLLCGQVAQAQQGEPPSEPPEQGEPEAPEPADPAPEPPEPADPEPDAPEPDDPQPDDPEEGPPADTEDDDAAPSDVPRLRRPQVEAPRVGPAAPAEEDAAEAEGAEAQAEEPETDAPKTPATPTPQAPVEPEEPAEPASEQEPSAVPGPAELEAELNEQAPEEVPESDWTVPRPVLTLRGYFRVRGELQDTFNLGHPGAYADSGADGDTVPNRPFARFCGADVLATSGCNSETLSYANMRLRLRPELSLNENVRVKATFDALDNVVFGSTPTSFYVPPASESSGIFASTMVPGTVVARRAWAEVRNRDLGELRFGRMAHHWGLGLRYNAGNGLDDDFSTEVDRVMAVTKLLGFYWMAMYDFAAEGPTTAEIPARHREPTVLPLDATQEDDVDQYTFAIASKQSPEERARTLRNGNVALEYGLLFQYRSQSAVSRMPEEDPMDDEPDMRAVDDPFTVRAFDANTFTWDPYVKLQWDSLRIGLEAALVHGGMERVDGDTTRDLSVFQLGAALETEYRLLDDRLGIYFDTGIATGDNDVSGLSASDDPTAQDGSDHISTFRFHPTYRVDLILWRNIMRQVTGAYYFKPGIGYDLIRSPEGQRLGGRLDAIYSRASSAQQTYGNDANLGVELNATIYWRTEGGADVTDGFRAMLQYGVLFPFDGLGARPAQMDFDVSTAQTLRLVLGVVY